MPKIDFTNEQLPTDLELPTKPIKLVENMKEKEVMSYIYQELHKIYKSEEPYIYKEMAKENIYHKLVEKSYDPEEFFVS